jgi:hypothetical protein
MISLPRQLLMGCLTIWAVTNAEQTRKEADFIQKMLQLSPLAALLDVPCANGDDGNSGTCAHEANE